MNFKEFLPKGIFLNNFMSTIQELKRHVIPSSIPAYISHCGNIVIRMNRQTIFISYALANKAEIQSDKNGLLNNIINIVIAVEHNQMTRCSVKI